MASQRYIDLVQALKLGTEAGKVLWEDLPDEEMFRARTGGGLVRIGKISDDRIGGPGGESTKGFAIWLIGHGGVIAGEVEFYPGEPGYDLMRDLYSSARLTARGGDMMIDNIVRQFNPTRS